MITIKPYRIYKMDNYPETKREATTETFHNVEVQEHYRWLEHPDNDDTKDWVERQSAFTTDYLDKHCSFRSNVKEMYFKY